MNRAAVRDRAQARRGGADLADRHRALAERVAWLEALVELLDVGNDAGHLVDGVVAALGCRSLVVHSETAPPDDLGEVLLAMLGRLNLCSGERKARHYDHEVKGLTVVRPYVGVASDVPAEATVFLAAHDSERGFVLSEGINPFYSDIDTHAMAAAVVDDLVEGEEAGVYAFSIVLISIACSFSSLVSVLPRICSIFPSNSSVVIRNRSSVGICRV